MHNEAAKHANDKRNRRKHHRDKNNVCTHRRPIAQRSRKSPDGKSDIAHAKRRSVIVGEDEGWMKFCD